MGGRSQLKYVMMIVMMIVMVVMYRLLWLLKTGKEKKGEVE
jgi:hypothetical protein